MPSDRIADGNCSSHGPSHYEYSAPAQFVQTDLTGLAVGPKRRRSRGSDRAVPASTFSGALLRHRPTCQDSPGVGLNPCQPSTAAPFHLLPTAPEFALSTGPCAYTGDGGVEGFRNKIPAPDFFEPRRDAGNNEETTANAKKLAFCGASPVAGTVASRDASNGPA